MKIIENTDKMGTEKSTLCKKQFEKIVEFIKINFGEKPFVVNNKCEFIIYFSNEINIKFKLIDEFTMKIEILNATLIIKYDKSINNKLITDIFNLNPKEIKCKKIEHVKYAFDIIEYLNKKTVFEKV